MIKILSDFKKRRKKNQEISEKPEVNCGNCKAIYFGNYCPECGQSAKEFDRPFSFMFYDFLGNIIAFDLRFFNTFYYLITRPGFLTKEFFKGRRTTYSPPFRIFVFLSFVLFLTLHYYTDRELDTVLNNEIKKESFAVIDSVGSMAIDSIMAEIPANIDTSVISINNINLTFNKNLFIGARNMRTVLNRISGELEKKSKDIEDPQERKKIQQYAQMCRSPEYVIAEILKYISWAFFIMLPVFALILKVFYIRRKQNFVRHLIFSIHLHSFWFIIMTFIVLGNLLFPGDFELFTFLLFLVNGIYFALALKKFYNQSLKKTIFKFLSISFVYNIILWSAIVVVLLKTFSIF